MKNRFLLFLSTLIAIGAAFTAAANQPEESDVEYEVRTVKLLGEKCDEAFNFLNAFLDECSQYDVPEDKTAQEKFDLFEKFANEKKQMFIERMDLIKDTASKEQQGFNPVDTADLMSFLGDSPSSANVSGLIGGLSREMREESIEKVFRESLDTFTDELKFEFRRTLDKLIAFKQAQLLGESIEARGKPGLVKQQFDVETSRSKNSAGDLAKRALKLAWTGIKEQMLEGQGGGEGGGILEMAKQQIAPYMDQYKDKYDKYKGIYDQYKDKYEEGKKVVGEYKEKYEEFKGKAQEKIEEGKQFAEQYQQKFEEGKQYLKNLHDQAKQKLQDGKDFVNSKIESGKEQFESLRQQAEEKIQEGQRLFEEYKEKLQQGVEEGKGQLEQLHQKAKSTFEEGQRLAAEYKEQAQEKFQELQGQGQEMLDKGKAKLGEMQDQAQEQIGGVRDQAQDAIEKGREQIGGLQDQAQEQIGRVRDQAQDAVEKGREQIGGLQDQAQEQIGRVRDQAQDAVEKGRKQIGGLQDQAQEQIGMIREQAQDTIEKGREQVGGLQDYVLPNTSHLRPPQEIQNEADAFYNNQWPSISDEQI